MTMKVLVTGVTGFVGAHAARSLQQAGHDVRGLVRTSSKVDSVTARCGVDVDRLEVCHGDATDPDAVVAAVKGCDAVVHAAAVVATDRRSEMLVEHTNFACALNVLQAAAVLGCDPVVHVSSSAALFPFSADPVTADHPVGTARSAYARSKANCERVARILQAIGHPIVTLYPGMVLGPHDYGGSTQLKPLTLWLTKPFPLSRGYAVTLVDVRDVAAAITAAMRSGRGARRYVMFGRRLSSDEILAEIRSVTQREIKSARLPRPVFRAWGVLGDASRRFGIDSVLTSESVDFMFNAAGGDHSDLLEDLGVELRPVSESLADTISWMAAQGLLSEQQAGAAVKPRV